MEMKRLRRLRLAYTNAEGQDLIEYALVVALIAFAAAAGMSAVASKINDAFTNIGTKVIHLHKLRTCNSSAAWQRFRTYPIPSKAAPAVATVLIVPDAARRASLARMLAGSHVPVVRECTTYPESRDLEELMALDGDVFVVDLDTNVEQALGLIENICSRDAAATVMATSRSSDSGLLIRSMRAGAREFLPDPILANTFTEAMARALARREKSQQPSSMGKVLVFAGAKGGSGVTTVATNFAIALTKEDAGKVVIVDMDLQLGEVALGLGLTPQFSVLDALKNEDRLDADFLMTMLVRHTSGLAVLASPEQYTSFSPLASSVRRLFSILRHQFAFVVVDAGTATAERKKRCSIWRTPSTW